MLTTGLKKRLFSRQTRSFQSKQQWPRCRPAKLRSKTPPELKRLMTHFKGFGKGEYPDCKVHNLPLGDNCFAACAMAIYVPALSEPSDDPVSPFPCRPTCRCHCLYDPGGNEPWFGPYPDLLWRHTGNGMARTVQHGLCRLPALVSPMGELASSFQACWSLTGCYCIFWWHSVFDQLPPDRKLQEQRRNQRPPARPSKSGKLACKHLHRLKPPGPHLAHRHSAVPIHRHGQAVIIRIFRAVLFPVFHHMRQQDHRLPVKDLPCII